MLYADIIIDISHEKLDRSFQYQVPAELEKEIQVGMVADLPFGNGNRIRKGYVIGLSREAKVDPLKIKEIISLRSSEETTEARLIALAAWMRTNYGSTMIQALKTVLPIQEKVRAKEKRYLCLNVSKEEGEALLEKLEAGRAKAQARLLRALLEEERLDFTWASKELNATAAVVKKLQDEGILRMESDEVFRSPIRPSDISPADEMPLTPSQEAAVQEIRKEWESSSPARCSWRASPEAERPRCI